MKQSVFCMIAAFAVFLGGTAVGAGFALNEMGARGNAMQGALIGSTLDASAVYFNPANLMELDGASWHFLGGVTLARPDYDTRAMGKTTDQDESIYPLPHLYFGTGIAENLFVGFGLYCEYGLGTSYEGHKSWPLAADSSETSITCFTLSPTIAWQATERLALGAGLRALYMNMISERMVTPLNSYFHLDVDDWGYSYLLSAAYQLTETIRLGAVYRGECEFNEKGDVQLTPVGIESGVTGDLVMPQSVSAGLNWQATEKLNLGVNLTFTDWSVYKSVDMNFSSPILPPQSVLKDWHDTMRYSFGAEYRLTDSIAVQCGYTYDEDPSSAGHSDTLCPPGDREQYALGLTYSKNDWAISVDYMLVIIHETDRIIHGIPTEFRNLRTDTFGISYSRKF